jgi:flagellar hook-associated protein 2
MGIALQDGTGSNFLAATGISGGTFNRGKNCLYSINDGAQLTSSSNTITEASSNLAGLTINALKENSTTTIQVSSDTEKVKKAITDFVDQYNKVQSLIDGQTDSSTDSSGKVTAALLSDDSDATQLATGLRGLVNATVSTLNVTVKRLDSLGIVSNGNDNNLSVADSEKLSAALGSNLNDVKNLFTNGTEGLATKLSAYLDKTVGDDGSIVTHQANLTKQSSAIDTQVADMERLIAQKKEQLTQAFVAMETAQANINQQLQYLTKNFGS